IRLAALTPFVHVPRVTCEYRHFRSAPREAAVDAPAPPPGQALGEDGWRRADFVETKARVLAKHAARLTTPLLARAIVGLRAETAAIEQHRRHAVDAADAEVKELRRLLDEVSAELRRVWGEEARLTTAARDLYERLDAALAAPAPAPE